MASRKRGVDSLLTARGKNLKQGESCSFRLVKGPSGTITADPVDPKAPKQSFPLVAKFPESVVKPDFTHKPWVDGRLYQQDVPKLQDDSDEEAGAKKEPKKRWKGYKRPEVVSRQWILQEQVDFLETMVARREKKSLPQNKLSSRYEGIPESNASHYALFLQSGSSIQVVTLPLSSTVVFSQPAARKTFSLSEAEQVIQDQRMGIRTMHHLVDQDSSNKAAEASASATTSSAAPVVALGPRRIQNKNSSKSRLLDKLKRQVKADDAEEADDIMGDVTFRNRKGTGGGARKELLQSLGDGIKVSDDGVLGGTDDAVFGGRQRFASFQAEQQKANAGEGGDGGANAERGADGAAMTDDFYQRDVQAEYEELDYDANEQFDDDDVDIGETEVVGDGDYEQDEEEEDDDEIEQEEAVSGVEGLASVAGFKMMLAKARGEVTGPPVTADGAEAANGDKKADETTQAKQEEEGDHMSKIMAAAQKAANNVKAKAATLPKKPAAPAIQVDENGLRIISLEAVRNEIWLNHGSIPVKRLMKIFDVKGKSSADRQEKFREVIKELCAMKTDPVGGRILVLKQHYANMG